MNEGDIVDDFELLDQHGQSVTLNDLVEAGPVVMFFYPKAMTLVEPWRAHFRDWPLSSLSSSVTSGIARSGGSAEEIR